MTGREPSDIYKLSLGAKINSYRWFGDTEFGTTLPHHALALCGEVGEVANIIKKVQRGSLSLNDAKVHAELAMELADVFTYLINIAAILKIDLLRAYEQKCVENERRFSKERLVREAANGRL